MGSPHRLSCHDQIKGEVLEYRWKIMNWCCLVVSTDSLIEVAAIIVAANIQIVRFESNIHFTSVWNWRFEIVLWQSLENFLIICINDCCWLPRQVGRCWQVGQCLGYCISNSCWYCFCKGIKAAILLGLYNPLRSNLVRIWGASRTRQRYQYGITQWWRRFPVKFHMRRHSRARIQHLWCEDSRALQVKAYWGSEFSQSAPSCHCCQGASDHDYS